MKMSPGRQVLLAVLGLMFLGLQARLWVGEGSLQQVSGLKKQVDQLRAQNQRLRERNALMEAEVSDLKSGVDAVEEIARKDLGMIRDGETFFLVVKGDEGAADDASR